MTGLQDAKCTESLRVSMLTPEPLALATNQQRPGCMLSHAYAYACTLV